MTDNLLERKIEDYFNKQVRGHGGEVRKLSWVNRWHAPDRFVALNGVWLVELKRSGGTLRAGQDRERARLSSKGVRCRVINSIEGVDEFIREVLSAAG